MTRPRLISIRNLSESTCSDCGAVVRDRDYFDPDNTENRTGAPACTCRPRAPPHGGD